MKKIYLERKNFVHYDERHCLVYLGEEVINDYIPETLNEEDKPKPCKAYSYSGPEIDGGTLIESDGSRDSLINGIIRSRYSDTEEAAIKTHQIIVLKNPKDEKADEYNKEWEDFEAFRTSAISTVDAWL